MPKDVSAQHRSQRSAFLLLRRLLCCLLGPLLWVRLALLHMFLAELLCAVRHPLLHIDLRILPVRIQAPAASQAKINPSAFILLNSSIDPLVIGQASFSGILSPLTRSALHLTIYARIARRYQDKVSCCICNLSITRSLGASGQPEGSQSLEVQSFATCKHFVNLSGEREKGLCSPDISHAIIFEGRLSFPLGRSLVHAQHIPRALVALLLRVVPLLRPVPVDVWRLHPAQTGHSISRRCLSQRIA